jgi:PAS domain S-box-containing protein
MTDSADRDDDAPPLRTLAGRRAEDLTAHLELALAAGGLGTWRWDARTGEVLWDERLERIFGLEPGAFDGTFDMWVSLIHPDDRERVLRGVDRAVEERTSYLVEHRVVWPDGTVRWLQGRGSVTFDEQGEVSGTIGCTGDITHVKRAEHQAREQARSAAAWAERERRARERLEFLVGLTEASLSVNSYQAFMDWVTAAAVPRLGDWCALHYLPPGGAPLERSVAHADPAKVAWAEALAARYPHDPASAYGVPAVMRSGRTEFLDSFDPELTQALIREASMPAAEAQAILDQLQLTSVITVPLRASRGVVGALQLVSAESGHRYVDEDVALAEAAAGRIGEAIERLWLSDQHRTISATLQRALLPPSLPDVPGIDLTARYWPAGAASEVGGDFYDVFPVERDVWALLIGDVCGTGSDAAAVSGIARYTARAAARHGQDHAHVLQWINDAVLHSGRDRFCTACFATLRSLDDGTFMLTSASGGHPLPVIVEADGRARLHGEPGTLLGVFDDIRLHITETRIGPGDVVTFYTDGITDLPPPYALDADGVLQLVSEAVADSRPARAEVVIERLRGAFEARLPLERRHDDIALLVVRAEGARG